MKIEYDDSGTWKLLPDVDGNKGIDIAKSSKQYKYARFALLPVASTIKFNVLNRNGKYSEGSGESVEGILDLDTKVRVRGGYRLGESTGEQSSAESLNGANDDFFRTAHSGGIVSIDSSAGNPSKYFPDLFVPLYDSETYDDSTYSADAYYVHVFDNTDYADINDFDITCNSADGTIYWRVADNLDAEKTESWTTAGATVNGTKTVTVNNSQGKRYLLIAVVWDGITWSNASQITGLTVRYEEFIEWVYYDVFYLDSPSFSDPKAPAMPMITCGGRDIFKRAIDADVNLEDLSGGIVLDQLVKDVCDVIGIQYTASSIADLSGFGNRTLSAGLEDITKAYKVFELIMQIINKAGNKYQMYMEYDSSVDDNILFVQPNPDEYVTDFVFNYKHYENLGNKRKNYDRLLKRISVFSDQQTIDPEKQLDTATYNTTGQKTLTWSPDAEYKRYTVVVNSGDAMVVLDDVNPGSIVFTISGTSIDVTITVFGNEWPSAPDKEGEWIDHDNMIANRGNTARMINPLVLSDAECSDIAQGFIERFGTPDKEANNLKYPYLHLLLEQNDMNLIWSRYTFVDDLYFITGIIYHWDNSARPADNTIFNLDDSGLDFGDLGDYIYDRDKAPVSGTIMLYDIGYVYDMADGPAATDAEIDAATEIIHNIGMAA
jgi:hypothetical protein